MTDRELMQQVYRYLTGESVRNKTTDKHIAELIREGLAQPKQEPLTNEELDALAIDEDGLPNSHFEFARAIEKAHGIGEKE